jgi:thiol:disulfide interchange protein DsbD
MHCTERLIARFHGLLGLAALAGLAATPGIAPAAEDFLQPDQAFRISGEVRDADTIAVSWDITGGYYLYANKIRLRSLTEGIEVGKPDLPKGETRQDEVFGAVEIYRNRVSVSAKLTRAPGSASSLTLEATSQGCADAGLCYPPHRQKLVLALPAAVTAQAPTPTATPTVTPAAAPTQAEPAPPIAAAPAKVPPPAVERALPKPAPITGRSQLNQALGLGGDDDILDPEDAFRFDASVASPDRLHLLWGIADGTYLYKDKLHIAIEGAPEVALGPIEWPTAEIKKDSILPDGSTGDVAVYHGGIDVTVPLQRGSTAPTQITLVAKYQGCAERGLCYPPITKRATLDLPAASQAVTLSAAPAPTPAPAQAAMPAPAAAPAASPGPEAMVSEQDQIAAVLAGGNLWAIIALFFGFGLLLALTPCVFPMIPILSGIIAGQGAGITTRKAFTLSLVYVLAMAATYTVAGVLAGLFGANIQAAFQNPWILSVFAAIFVALALSMFGFYELQLPSALQSRVTEMSNRQQGGSLVGVAIMGLLSALIVGPCVAPPLAGALIFIGQTGDAVLGGLALFAMSLGMGVPLIAIGTSAGKYLPRAGAWMDAVKAVFGVLLLGVAIMLLERVLPAAVSLLLWGLLAICSAVYMGATEPLPAQAGGWTRLWKGLGLALLVYGALMLVGVAAGGKDTIQPLRGLVPAGGGGTAAAPHASFKRIKTVADLDRELAAATAAGRPVMLDFYADWCVSCKEMERYTFADPKVIAEMDRFTLLQADVTANDAQDQELMQGRFKIPGPPAMLFFDRTGAEQRGFRVVGFKPAAEFVTHLQKAAP